MKNPPSSVPLLDLKAQLSGIREEILAAVTGVIDSTQYIMGPHVESLEAALADYTGTAHAVGVSSGTDALLLALMALDVGPGDWVVTSDFSFFATAGVIARLNATPLFVDIDPVSFNIDPEKLAQALHNMPEQDRQNVKAIIPVHLYGQCADMAPILSVANQYQIPVIEDAAQAIGAEYSWEGTHKKAGALGNFGCFSFFPSKNLGGMGDGGMVVTNDDALAHMLKLKRVHGGSTEYEHTVIGGNFRLDPMQAAILSVKLPYLNQWHAARQHNAAYYSKLFQQSNVASIQLPEEIYQQEGLSHGHIYNQFVIRVPQRPKLQTFLKNHHIATKVYYPVPFHQQACFQHLGYEKGDFPEAEKAAEEVLALPIYPELTASMQEYVVEKIVEFYHST